MAVFFPFLKTIPWATLLAQAPVILENARDLLKAIPRSPKETRSDEKENTVQNLRTRIENLEGSYHQSAAIVKQIADQLQGVTETLPVLVARFKLLFLFFLTNMILGLIALAIAILV